MKKTLALALVLLLIFAISSLPVMAIGNAISISINGATVVFPDAQPFVDGNNRIQVPVRIIAEALGKTVSWFEDTRTVCISVGKGAGGDSIFFVIGSNQMRKNADIITMDTEAVLKDGRTFIPIRYFAESLNFMVEWDGAANSVNLINASASCATNDNILWAKNLKVNDVSRIEAVRMPAMENERYKDFDKTDFARIVEIINNAKGKRINNPEEIVGSCITFYITTTDGTRHTFSNNGNTYLVLDGVSFDAGYDWLDTWAYEALNGKVPENFEF